MSDQQPTCEQCRHFYGDECRRFPPQSTMEAGRDIDGNHLWFTYFRYPSTSASAPPCGEFNVKDYFPCEQCGTLTHIDQLDAKPSNLRGPACRFFSWIQLWRLRREADRGADFDRLECVRCYGPSYCKAES